MIEAETPEGLMVWLMNLLADRFGNRAVLKGGMELRLLGCPRHTNDIDYVFVPFVSKKDVAPLVLGALREIGDLHVEHSLNSKCLKCICTYNAMRVQIEINVALECESRELTTATLARRHNQQGRIVRGMRFDVALAHKLAAWNERGLIRDLYDCAFMADTLSVSPEISTLRNRLSNVALRKGRKTVKASMTLGDLIDKLESATVSLSQKSVEEQMRDYLAPEELPGLEMKMRVGLAKLIAAFQT